MREKPKKLPLKAFQDKGNIGDSKGNLSALGVGSRMAIGSHIHFHALGAKTPTAHNDGYFSISRNLRENHSSCPPGPLQKFRLIIENNSLNIGHGHV